MRLDSGPAFYLGELEIERTAHLPADLVQRYSHLPGAPYDPPRPCWPSSGLQNTPHFGSVIVDIERDPALAAAVPVRVQVTEAFPRFAGVGAGFSTTPGARRGHLWRLHLCATRLELSTGLRVEERRQAPFADVFLPPLGNHSDSLGALVESSDLEGLLVDSQALGVARTTVRGDLETQLALRLQHETIELAGGRVALEHTLTATGPGCNARWMTCSIRQMATCSNSRWAAGRRSRS